MVKSIAYWLETKLVDPKIVRFVLLCSLVVICLTFLEHLLRTYIVGSVFAYVTPCYLNDAVIFLTATIISGYCFFQIKRGFTISWRWIIVVCGFAIYYLSIRFGSDVWELTPFLFLPKIKYADVLLVGALGQILVFIFGSFKTVARPINAKSFILDIPISLAKEDYFNRSTFAKRIADRITNSPFDHSFAIAITAPWGSGKTSFINLLKQEFPEDSILIDFKPEFAFSETELLSDFYSTLISKLSHFSSQLHHLLVLYGKTYSSEQSNGLVVRMAKDVIPEGIYTGDLKSEINRNLLRLNKQIVVFIDDMDRLDKKEIATLIRFMRNAVDFSCIRFVAAFDRGYVCTAIRDQINDYEYEKYLEKIFLAEYPITPPNSQVILKYVGDYLVKVFPDKEEDVSSMITLRRAGRFVHTSFLIRTMRDAKRFLNNFVVSYEKMKRETIFSEYFRIELIRFKFPLVHQLLMSRKEEFFEIKGSETAMKFLKRVGTSGSDEIVLKQYLISHKVELHLDEDDINMVISILGEMFDKNASVSEKHLSILRPGQYDNYFQFEMLEDQLSEGEFLDTMSLDLDVFYKVLDEWVDNKMDSQALYRFEQTTTHKIESKDEFLKLIYGPLHILRRIHKMSLDNFNERIFISGWSSKIARRFVHTDSRQIRLFFQNDKNNLEKILFDILEGAKVPFFVESEFGESLLNEDSYDRTLPTERILNILLRYFETYATQKQTLDSTFWALYNNCVIVTQVEVGRQTYQKKTEIDPRATEILKRVIDEYCLDEYLLGTIEDDRSNESIYMASNFSEKIYGSLSAFLLYLETKDETKYKYVREFKQFLKEFLANDPPKYIPFTFKDIPFKPRWQRISGI